MNDIPRLGIFFIEMRILRLLAFSIMYLLLIWKSVYEYLQSQSGIPISLFQIGFPQIYHPYISPIYIQAFSFCYGWVHEWALGNTIVQDIPNLFYLTLVTLSKYAFGCGILKYYLMCTLLFCCLCECIFYSTKKILCCDSKIAFVVAILIVCHPMLIYRYAIGIDGTILSLAAMFLFIAYSKVYLQSGKLTTALFAGLILIFDSFPPYLFFTLVALTVIYLCSAVMKESNIKFSLLTLRYLTLLIISSIAMAYLWIPMITEGFSGGYYSALFTQSLAYETMVANSFATRPPFNFIGYQASWGYNYYSSYVSPQLQDYFMNMTCIQYLLLFISIFGIIGNSKSKNSSFILIYLLGITFYAGSYLFLSPLILDMSALLGGLLRSTAHAISLLLLGQAFLLTMGLDKIYKTINKKNIIRFDVIIFALIIIILSPLAISGNLYGNQVNIEIPHEYNELNLFLNRELCNSSFRVYAIGPEGLAKYDWIQSRRFESNILIYFGIPYLYLFDLRPSSPFPAEFIHEIITGGTNSKYIKFLPKLMNMMEIKYLLIQNDILENKKNIKLNKSLLRRHLTEYHFGPNLELYMNPLIVSRVYVPNYVIVGNISTVDDLNYIDLMTNDSFLYSDIAFIPETKGIANKILANISIGINNSLFLKKSSNDYANRFVILNNSQDVLKTTISQSEYRLSINNVSSPFFIITTDRYHPLWKTETYPSSTIYPMFANGYANAYLICPHILNTSYDVKIYYDGCKYNFLGMCITLILPLIVISFFVISRIKKI